MRLSSSSSILKKPKSFRFSPWIPSLQKKGFVVTCGQLKKLFNKSRTVPVTCHSTTAALLVFLVSPGVPRECSTLVWFKDFHIGFAHDLQNAGLKDALSRTQEIPLKMSISKAGLDWKCGITSNYGWALGKKGLLEAKAVYGIAKPKCWKPKQSQLWARGYRITMLQLCVLKPPQTCTNINHVVSPLSERNDDVSFGWNLFVNPGTLECGGPPSFPQNISGKVKNPQVLDLGGHWWRREPS